MEAGDFIVARGLWAGFLIRSAMALVCGALGWGFSHIPEPDGFRWGAYGLWLLGAWIFATSVIRVIRRVEDVVLRVNQRGIDLADTSGLPPRHYVWGDVVRIVLAERLVARSGSEDEHQNRRVIAYLEPSKFGAEGFWTRARRGRRLSPDREPIDVGVYARGEQQRTLQTLRQRAPRRLPIEACAELVFGDSGKRDDLRAKA